MFVINLTYALLCVHSSLKRKTAIIVLQMYCYFKCSVALPHDAVGWSAMCDCGIFLSYSLSVLQMQKECNIFQQKICYDFSMSTRKKIMKKEEK